MSGDDARAVMVLEIAGPLHEGAEILASVFVGLPCESKNLDRAGVIAAWTDIAAAEAFLKGRACTPPIYEGLGFDGGVGQTPSCTKGHSGEVVYHTAWAHRRIECHPSPLRRDGHARFRCVLLGSLWSAGKLLMAVGAASEATDVVLTEMSTLPIGGHLGIREYHYNADGYLHLTDTQDKEWVIESLAGLEKLRDAWAWSPGAADILDGEIREWAACASEQEMFWCEAEWSHVR